MPSSSIIQASGTVMGGGWQVKHIRQPDINPDHVSHSAFAALQLVDMQMSTYKNSSDLMRLNQAPLDTWVTIPTPMAHVIDTAERIADFTDGALDITLGKAVNAWGFGPDPVPEHIPEITLLKNEAIDQLASYERQFSPTAIKKNRDIAFDLCALAKGFAVDQAARTLQALGLKHFLIEASGEIYAQGHRPDGAPWQVGLELPIPGNHIVYGQIALDGYAVATSGNYRNRRQIDDQEFTHVINPTNGVPVCSDLLAVTVIDDTCMRADALATALFIKGAKDGSAFADTHDLPALFLIRTHDGICELRSQAWVDKTTPSDQEISIAS